MCRREKSWEATLSNRQDSSTVSVEEATSVTKLLECIAKALRASAAALRVAQSVLARHSWIVCNNGSTLCCPIAPTCNKWYTFTSRTSLLRKILSHVRNHLLVHTSIACKYANRIIIKKVNLKFWVLYKQTPCSQHFFHQMQWKLKSQPQILIFYTSIKVTPNINHTIIYSRISNSNTNWNNT